MQDYWNVNGIWTMDLFEIKRFFIRVTRIKWTKSYAFQNICLCLCIISIVNEYIEFSYCNYVNDIPLLLNFLLNNFSESLSTFFSYVCCETKIIFLLIIKVDYITHFSSEWGIYRDSSFFHARDDKLNRKGDNYGN